jgi:hypothetical protein
MQAKGAACHLYKSRTQTLITTAAVHCTVGTNLYRSKSSSSLLVPSAARPAASSSANTAAGKPCCCCCCWPWRRRWLVPASVMGSSSSLRQGGQGRTYEGAVCAV